MTTRTQDMYGGAEPPPWDIGRPQQAFIDLVAQGEILGDVLDVGCGTGALARYLIAQGRSVLGIDLSLVAIAQAQSLYAHSFYLGGPDRADIVTPFRVHSALELPALGRKFDSVVDCGLLHQFSDEDRATYLQGIARVLRTGGRYYALIWSDKAPDIGRGPRRYSTDEISAAFSGRYRSDEYLHIHTLDKSIFENRTSRTPAWLIIAEKV